MTIQAAEGTKDLLPGEAQHWEDFKRMSAEVFGRYGYVLIDTPVFEQTELFVRGIGEATDVVSKEMFQAVSGENLKRLVAGEAIKGKSRLSLRPEGTAGVVRAAVQHNLVPPGAAPVKLMYAGPMFRAERPQKGRQRQFNQVGIECLGAQAPSADAEAIIMLMRFFEAIGIPAEATCLLVNSLGCDECRPAYRERLYRHLQDNAALFCEECLRRAESNPLRAFDCKNPQCASAMEQAPMITESLCGACQEHHGQVKSYLAIAGVPYREEPRLVRGLDYYTRTVFEAQVTEGLGSQNAIGGGGRYDKLAEEVGGNPTPGLGFAIGYERCVLALKAAGYEFPSASTCDVFVACVDGTVQDAAFEAVQTLRDSGLSCEMDHQGRSLKSQFKLADRQGASLVLIFGPDELAEGSVTVRNMETHEEAKVSLEGIADKGCGGLLGLAGIGQPPV
ncbi:MAG: histidine--tRNA ligase [Eggerthellaceae bacterium]|jgi:histidyl-tRNA synthetase|nr:histidine--tRNA ligase [Eggerthellaceae bacterium]MDR2715592.1 histidine--tRNA ligase [Coriobacteriaceae bacterium]